MQKKKNVRITLANFQTADLVAIHLSFIMQAKPHRQKKRGIHDRKNGKRKENSQNGRPQGPGVSIVRQEHHFIPMFIIVRPNRDRGLRQTCTVAGARQHSQSQGWYISDRMPWPEQF